MYDVTTTGQFRFNVARIVSGQVSCRAKPVARYNPGLKKQTEDRLMQIIVNNWIRYNKILNITKIWILKTLRRAIVVIEAILKIILHSTLCLTAQATTSRK